MREEKVQYLQLMDGWCTACKTHFTNTRIILDRLTLPDEITVSDAERIKQHVRDCLCACHTPEVREEKIEHLRLTDGFCSECRIKFTECRINHIHTTTEKAVESYADRVQRHLRDCVCTCHLQKPDLVEKVRRESETIAGLSKPEAVNHPSHYGGESDPLEHIKVANALGWNYNIGNCTKYLWRAGKKDPAKTLEDLRKARFYLDYEIQRREREGK